MSVHIIEPQAWPTIRDAIKPAPSLWDPFVPAHAITMLHGPGGSGKSGLLYGLANAIQTGQDFLGLPTQKAKCLLISVDMNLFLVKERWGTAFNPNFAFVCPSTFDLLDPRFRMTTTYTEIRDYVNTQGIELVLIDALSGTVGVHSVNDDATANGWYSAIKQWFPESAVVFLHHDRKTRYNDKGEPLAQSGQNSMGTAYWINNCASQIHMWPAGDHISMIRHEKCQVNLKHDDKIKLYIDIDGRVEPWDQRRADNVQLKYWETARSLNVQDLPNHERDVHIAKFHNVSERTVRRWRSL